MFKTGDKVVCIDDRGWNDLSTQDFILKKYMVFDVLDTIFFENKQSIDIGARFNDPSKHTKQFYSNNPIPGPGIHWAGSHRFKLISERDVEGYNELLKKELKEELEKVLAEEEYETAVKIKELLSN